MRRSVQPQVTVGYVSKSATGFNSVLSCGHGRIVTQLEAELARSIKAAQMADEPWEALLPEGYRPGDEVACAHCPPIVVDEYDMFRDVRRRLGTEG